MFAVSLFFATALAFTPVLGPGDPLPDAVLIDQSARPVALARLHASAILTFVYTRCPDPRMCPLTTAKFARLQTLLAGTRVRLVEITLDPGYDRVPVLAAYGRAAGADPARWSLLTGDPERTLGIADRLGVASSRTRPGTLVHTEALVLTAADGRIREVVDGNAWTPDEVAGEARALDALPANPFARLQLRVFGEMAALCGAGAGAGVSVATVAAIFAGVLGLASVLALRIVRRSSHR